MRDGKAIYEGEGVKTILTNDGMTIGTYIKFPSLVRSGTCKVCLESAKGWNVNKNWFDYTSRFARL